MADSGNEGKISLLEQSLIYFYSYDLIGIKPRDNLTWLMD